VIDNVSMREMLRSHRIQEREKQRASWRVDGLTKDVPFIKMDAKMEERFWVEIGCGCSEAVRVRFTEWEGERKGVKCWRPSIGVMYVLVVRKAVSC
jgi:hypothetical protein